MIIRKSERELDLMREAGRIVGEAHKLLADEVKPGVTTDYLDQIVEEFIRSQDADPTFKGYRGFPKSICASINEEIVHGIPGEYELKSGDIIGVDIGARVGGYCGDAARTFAVGEISKEAKKLMETTSQALEEGIKKALVGNRVSDISNAVQIKAESEGFSVVRKFVGHGIGKEMWEDPEVPNFGKPGKGPRLKEGMVLAIEPMVNVGTFRTKTLDDGWTVITEDKELSAHFEDTVAITKDGPEILTRV